MTPVFKNDDVINNGCGFLKKKNSPKCPQINSRKSYKTSGISDKK